VRQVAALLAFVVLTGCATGGPVLDANGNAATLKQAQELRRADRSDQAAAIIERALLTTAPGNVALQGELARDVVFGDPARALDLIGQAFDPAAPDAKLMMVGGVANDLLGHHAEAQKLYADALKIAPNNPAILANVEASRRMIAVEDRGAPENKKVAATSMPKRPAKRASDVPTASPVVVSTPAEAAKPTFRERWRIL
jgi:Flp pilus assembly protein TadD